MTIRDEPLQLEPAQVVFDTRGTPFSPVYGDVYHSADSGPGQARHVFLGGNDLPRRWAGARAFTIVETGFGLGLNFLATWSAWRADPARCDRLHFVSIEKHPFTREALTGLHRRYGEFAPLAAQLQAVWPQRVPGLHRLHFEDGHVTLTLALADVAQVRRLSLTTDAFFLDGFAPERNVEMWTPRIIKSLARLARHGATLATYTSARAVREELAAAGFAVDKRTGFGHKRDMLAARFAPRWQLKHAPHPAPVWPEQHAIIIGAGLAGAAAAERLAARGWRIDLIERNATPAAEASGLHAGVFHPHVSRDDSALSRLTRAGFLYALSRWSALEAAGHGLAWQQCGVLQLPDGAADEIRMATTLKTLGYPPEYAQYVGRDAASLHAGHELHTGGLWFPHGGWMQGARLVAALIAACPRVVTHYGNAVHSLQREGERWQALAADGTVIACAPVVVLANANDATRLVPVAQHLGSSRGQLTYLPSQALPPLCAVLTGPGCLLPAIDDVAVLGSTYDFDDGDPAPHDSGHERNIARLSRLIPENVPDIDQRVLRGGVGFRCVAPDRLPLIGALPDIDTARASQAELSGAQMRDLPRHAGLYGAFGYASRGLTWASLGGELIASLIEGEPLPIESDLADAIDPGRFALKLARRGML